MAYGRVALPPHRTKAGTPFCLEFACSPRVCVGFSLGSPASSLLPKSSKGLMQRVYGVSSWPVIVWSAVQGVPCLQPMAAEYRNLNRSSGCLWYLQTVLWCWCWKPGIAMENERLSYWDLHEKWAHGRYILYKANCLIVLVKCIEKKYSRGCSTTKKESMKNKQIEGISECQTKYQVTLPRKQT